MNITKIIQPIQLLSGSHTNTAQTGQGCFMNVIAYLNGENQITDESPCVCYVIRPIAIMLNDLASDEQRQKLLPYVQRAMGTATNDKNVVMNRVNAALVFAGTCKGIAAKYAKSAAKSAEYAKSAANSAAEYAEYAKSAKSAAKSAEYAKSAAEHAAKSAEYTKSAAEHAAEYAEYAKSAKSAEYAKSAAKSAEYAANSAAESAEYAKSAAEYAAKYAANSAESAAEHAAKYAKYAKYAAEYAANSAESAEYAAKSAESAESAEYAEYAAKKQAIFDAGLVFMESACNPPDVYSDAAIKRANELVKIYKENAIA